MIFVALIIFFSIFAIEYSIKLLFHLIIIIMEKIFMRFSLMFMCLVLFFSFIM